jgi:hypothetical protein
LRIDTLSRRKSGEKFPRAWGISPHFHGHKNPPHALSEKKDPVLKWLSEWKVMLFRWHSLCFMSVSREDRMEG